MNFDENKNYYEILGVAQDASIENITRARDRLKFGDSDDRVPFWMWDDIDKAYSTLSDSASRRQYDEFLRNRNILSNVRVARTADEYEQFLSDRENSSDYVMNDFSVAEAEPVQKEETPVAEAEPVQKEEVPVVEAEPVQKEEAPVVEAEPVQTEETPVEEAEPVQKEEVPVAGSQINTSSEFDDDIELDESDLTLNPNIRRLSKQDKKLRIAIIAGGFFLFGPVGAIGAGVVFTKIKQGKLKLKKINFFKTLKLIKTNETQLMDKYNKLSKESIEKLLNSPHNDFKLKIEKIRLKNQIQLLKEQINFRKGIRFKAGRKLFGKSKTLALKMKFNTLVSDYEKLSSLIDNYSKDHDINQSIDEIKTEIDKYKGTDEYKKPITKNMKVNIKQFQQPTKFSIYRKNIYNELRKKFSNDEETMANEGRSK